MPRAIRWDPLPYLGAALTTNDERYYKLEFSALDDGKYSQDVKGGWIAILQHYFISAWVADPTPTIITTATNGRMATMWLVTSGRRKRLHLVRRGNSHREIDAGPKNQTRLEAIAPNLNLTVDYGFLWWLAIPIFHLLKWLHGVVGNWGVSIILLTLIIKLVLFPLSAASYRSMANMRRVGPQMKRMQERYAGDRQKLSQEMMSLYKKEKINPLGGCLPMCSKCLSSFPSTGYCSKAWNSDRHRSFSGFVISP